MSEHEALLRARERARSGVETLRAALLEEFGTRDDVIIGVNGSYARQEVTEDSDVDIFFLGTQSVIPAASAQEIFLPKLTQLGFKPPSAGGVFDNPLPISALRDNIGGSDDTNQTITRRMLFLLEGEWLLNEKGFRSARTEILEAYLRDTAGEGHLCKYFLNDVVRYWRTICVDYEDKARFLDKPRGIRYIKLRFSRLLLYLAGVLAAAQTYDLDRAAKLRVLEDLLAINPIDRIRRIVGALADPLVARYADFLAALDDAQMRRELRVLGPSYKDTPTFRRLRDSAGEFREEILRMLLQKYGAEHEIIKALLI